MMMRWLNSLLFIFCICSTTLAAKKILDRVIVRVDNAVITQSDLDEAMMGSIADIKKNYPKEQWKTKLSELRQQVLQRMIDEYVCVRAARDLEVKVTDEEVEAHLKKLWENAGLKSKEAFREALEKEGMTWDEMWDSVKRQSLVSRVMQKEVYSKINITEADIKNYYAAHESVYKIPAAVHVALIMLPVSSGRKSEWDAAETKMNEIYNQLEAGADFSEMVKKYSRGPAVDSGGDIGFVESGKGLPEFEKVAYSLKVGEFSHPFKTPHGWSIIKLLDKRDASLKPLSEVKSDIKELLTMLRSRDLSETWLEKQRAKTFIERIK